ncbi:hypothetical protein HZ326_5664 [Fusarium oxysporum f. sp. albedinis]|nr:hypothetical protein HZ326_5664 [Fusarium oxysporum f. sp. albedinis]
MLHWSKTRGHQKRSHLLASTFGSRLSAKHLIVHVLSLLARPIWQTPPETAPRSSSSLPDIRVSVKNICCPR